MPKKEVQSFSIKTAQTIGGLALIAGSLFLIVLTLLTQLVPSVGTTLGSAWAWAFAALVLCLLLHSGLWWTRQSLAMREANLGEIERKNLLSQMAKAIAIYNRFRTGIKGTIFLAIMGLLTISAITYFVYRGINEGFAFPAELWLMLVIYLAYFTMLHRIPPLINRKISHLLRKQVPSYELKKDKLIIDLNIKSLGKQKGREWTVEIGLDDIDEVRHVTWVEAQSLLDYEIGPDVRLQWQASKDLYLYLSEKLDRPRAYNFLATNGANHLFILGKNLFYLISVQNEDVSDLLEAVNK